MARKKDSINGRRGWILEDTGRCLKRLDDEESLL
jgi:hypothetical protein